MTSKTDRRLLHHWRIHGGTARRHVPPPPKP